MELRLEVDGTDVVVAMGKYRATLHATDVADLIDNLREAARRASQACTAQAADMVRELSDVRTEAQDFAAIAEGGDA